jgi:hypothetical protein
MPANQDPDAALVALFRYNAKLNEAKTNEAGRPIYDDEEICEIRFPGSRNVSVFPATAMSHWSTDPETGGQIKVTYAERFRRQYQQFKSHNAQTKSGTPLGHAPFLTEARRAELRAQNIYTVEALAAIDGQELKNLGFGGRELKNGALEFIAESKTNAPNLQMQSELEALRAKNAVLEEDMQALKAQAEKKVATAEGEFDNMTLEQLREFIHTNTGQQVIGTPNRKSLVRMAMDCRPDKAA